MHDSPLLRLNPGYYEYRPGLWLPGKHAGAGTMGTLSKKAVDAAGMALLFFFRCFQGRKKLIFQSGNPVYFVKDTHRG